MIPVLVDGVLHYLKVIKLKYLRDSALIRKVLDIADDYNVLSSEVEVSELSFNEHPGYLLH